MIKRNHIKTSAEQQAQEMVGTDWFNLDQQTQHGLIADFMVQGAIKPDPRFEKYAVGGAVATAATEKVKVTFKLTGGKEVIKGFDSKAEADEAITDFVLENDVESVKVDEVKEEKKSLFSMAKEKKSSKASGKDKNRYDIEGIESEISEYKELVQKIKILTADKELIGGKLKQAGKEAFIELYEEGNRRPENFNLADGDEKILFMVQDKYIKVEPSKVAMLEKYGEGLVETVNTYKFTDLIEKKVDGERTIGDIVNQLILECPDISEKDKLNLIEVERVTRIPKGTIERLMDYEKPAEVFELIQPIMALK